MATDPQSLAALFRPQSVALLGASADPAKLSGVTLQYLQVHGYQGQVYPINPRYPEISGIRCYPSLRAVPGPIDLALVLVGAEQVSAAVDDCIAAGVQAIVVYASGFAEIGEEGRRLQDDLVARCRAAGVRLVGPNCQGVITPGLGLAASFTQALRVPKLLPGKLAFCSQSGAIGGSFLDMSYALGQGLAYWISVGNQADVGVVECADYMLDDPDVGMVALYMEGLKDAAQYLAVADKAARLAKPLLVLKSGRSEVGVRAAASHTGALAGSAAVFDAASRQHGAILVQDLDELLDCAMAIAQGRPARGGRLGVLTTSGGAGVLLADGAEPQGLSLPVLAQDTQDRLSAVVPAYGATANPVDVTATLVSRMLGGEVGGFERAIVELGSADNIDTVIVALTMITGSAAGMLADEVIAASRRLEKPVLVAWLGADLCAPGFSRLQQAGVPLYHGARRAVRAARALADWGAAQGAGPGKWPAAGELALPTGGGALAEWQAAELLTQAGVRTPKGGLARSAAEATTIAAGIGGPVVMKVQSPDILHKTDIGGIRLGVTDPEACFEQLLAQARDRCPGARLDGVLVQEQLAGGTEVLVGVTRDPQFGPVLAFGLGGVTVEALGDVSLLHLPASRSQIESFVANARAYRVLTGFRGRPPGDIPALVETLQRLTDLALALGARLADLEVNPLLVLPAGEGVCALDALVRLT